jgi:hypothetical protein
MNQQEQQEKQQLQMVRTESVFSSIQTFEDAQRMVKPLASSQFIPANFQGRIDDCLIAMEMSYRMKISPLMVLQNTYIVHGKPAFSSQFLISLVNASKVFATSIRYKEIGERGKDSFGCIAWAKDKDGEVLEGPAVTIEMAKAEGWMSKPGSKWKTMPDVMLRYRAATFFTRFYAPEIAMGMQTREEVIDVESLEESAPKSRFDKSLLTTEQKLQASTPPPPPPIHRRRNEESEKDLAKDVTLFDANKVDETPQDKASFKELSFEEQLEITLKHLECNLTIDQVHELCKKHGVEFGSYLLHNEAQGLRTVLSHA